MTLAPPPTETTRARRNGDPKPRVGTRRPHKLSLVVVVIGLVVTAGLATGSRLAYDRNQTHILRYDLHLTADALQADPLYVEDHVGSAANIAAATNGKASDFDRALKGAVGAKDPLLSATLYEVGADGSAPKPITRLGGHQQLSATSARASALFASAAHSPTFAVTMLATRTSLRLGYAVFAAGIRHDYISYTEEKLAANRRVTVAKSSPLSNVNFALYFGTKMNHSTLIESTTPTLPLSGLTAKIGVPYGDATLTLVMSPHGSLVGGLEESIAWLIVLAGVLLSLGAAVMTEGLVRRREDAEALASENRRLYQGQRNVAEVLQRSLLPEIFPLRDDLEIAVRYLPGAAGVEVGGDWYDVIEIDEDHLFFVIGDVCGRGLRAATLMASLRHSANAYAADGDSPEEILSKLWQLEDPSRDGLFATALCGIVSTRDQTMTIANAGHPEPLLVSRGGEARFVRTEIGLPVGVVRRPRRSTTVSLENGASVLFFTDGLFERREEDIDESLERLRRLVSMNLPLESLLDRALQMLGTEGPPDDIAILGLRWHDLHDRTPAARVNA